MEFTKLEIEEIKQRLKQGQKIEDLAYLVNHIINLQNLKSGTKYKPITIKRLKFYYANINKKYLAFDLPKKTGGTRPIAAPDKFLKKIQRRINLILSLLFLPREAAHGFIEHRSIVTNAKVHVAKKYILNVDLKEFFPTIHFGRIKAVFQLKPFELKPEFAHILSNFCCLNGTLPQGAPTSPILTNLVCQKFDSKLVKLSKEYHCFYTRYADDITFSSVKNKFNEEFISKLEAVIKSEGFNLNEKKTRLQKKSARQEVTGIIVNQKLNLARDYIRTIRAILNNWERSGYEKAKVKFEQHYPQEKGFMRNKSIPEMENVLMGKILFLGMVRGKEDILYLKYKAKLKILIELKNRK